MQSRTFKSMSERDLPEGNVTENAFLTGRFNESDAKEFEHGNYLRCVSCSKLFIPSGCSNCGNSRFILSDGSRFRALECDKCTNIIEYWDCPNCNARNPMVNTLVKLDRDRPSKEFSIMELLVPVSILLALGLAALISHC